VRLHGERGSFRKRNWEVSGVTPDLLDGQDFWCLCRDWGRCGLGLVLCHRLSSFGVTQLLTQITLAFIVSHVLLSNGLTTHNAKQRHIRAAETLAEFCEIESRRR